MARSTTALLKLYPYIQQTIGKNQNSYKRLMSSFFEERAKELYDVAPCDRLFFRDSDYQKYFSMTGIDENKVKQSISETYYGTIGNFNPRAAKDPLVVSQMLVIRYFYMKRDQKNLELSYLYLAFSGKFYPSIHYASYPQTPPSQYRHVMEYVVNNMLSEKYDLKTQGSVFGTIKSISTTWMKSYGDRLKRCNDDDIVYLIQQLHNRIKSFMKNIASLYYDAYKNKDKYFAYDSESLDSDNFHLIENDAIRAEGIVNRSMERINTKDVDYKICKHASDKNVKVEEVKSIVQTIVTDPKNQPVIKELLNNIVTMYFHDNPGKDINDIAFVNYAVSPKPNAKSPELMRQKEIVVHWLDEGSPAYRKRKHRKETAASYHRSVFAYFALTIYYANK